MEFPGTRTGVVHDGENALRRVMLVDYDRNYTFTQVGPQNLPSYPPLLPRSLTAALRAWRVRRAKGKTTTAAKPLRPVG